jgi:hypothetical protein
VAWSELRNGQIHSYLARCDAMLQRITGDVLVSPMDDALSSNEPFPTLQATSSGYAMAWFGGSTHLWSAAVSSDGSVNAHDLLDTPNPSTEVPSLAATPAGYVLAWGSESGADYPSYVAALNPDASLGAMRTLSAPGAISDGAFVATASDVLAILWADDSVSYFELADASGAAPGTPTVIDVPGIPDAFAAGAGWYVALWSSLVQSPDTLAAATIATDGTLGPVDMIAEGFLAGGEALVATDRSYAIAWTDQSSGTALVYFTIVVP